MLRKKKPTKGKRFGMRRKYTGRRRPALTKDDMAQIDYKNVEFLQKYIGETLKIIPRRATNMPGILQHRVATEIKRARLIALLPYTDRHQL